QVRRFPVVRQPASTRPCFGYLTLESWSALYLMPRVPMPSQRHAVIDVGTNSVKLLVAQVSGSRVDPLFEQSEQTRLGSGFYQTHRLQPAPIARTARAVSGFARIAAEWSAASTRVIATSAARDALNQEELLAAIQAASGLTVEVISGEQEADWAFRGVR